MQRARVIGRSRKKSAGFSLFEMVVVICSIVILYMVAEQRLNEMPAAAERASFMAVLEQIKTGVNFEMVTRLAGGHGGEIRSLEGKNPMDFLIEPPSNYRGELDLVTDAVERRSSWYFETSTGQLVYVVGGASIQDVQVTLSGTIVHLGQIRLKLTNVYSASEEPEEAGRGSARGGSRNAPANNSDNWEALVLAPVNEYLWDRRPEQPIPLN